MQSISLDMLLNKPKFDLCIAVLGKKPKNRHSIAKNELFRNKSIILYTTTTKLSKMIILIT